MKNTSLIHCLLAASLLGSLSTAQDRAKTRDVGLIAGQPFCADSVEDQSAPGNCIPASTMPTLGMLYPLSNDFFVAPTGFVGVNTNAPLARLHVQGADIGASIIQSAAVTGVFVEDVDAVLTLASTEQGIVGSVISMPHFSSNVFQDQWAMYRGTASSGSNLRFSYGTSGNWATNPAFLNLTPDGNLGIGINTPSERLQVNGAIRADNYFLNSDARLKDDVHELEGSLEKLSELRGVSFVWDRKQRPEAEKERQLGFLAQEVREVLPELVREDDKGQLSVAYTQVIPVLVEAVQELEAEVARLRREIEEKR